MPYDTTLPKTTTALTAPQPLTPRSGIEEYRNALAAFKAGDWAEERFTAFRRRFGNYGQPQPGVQMVRIKVPGGLLPVAGARRIAHVARRFAKGEVHIAAGHDVQIHHVDLNAMASLIKALHAVGLTTADSPGNRNTNALAGRRPDEPSDADRLGVIANLSFGRLSAAQLDGLADIAEHFARDGLHTTREQNIAMLGIEPALAEDVVDAVRSLGIAVEGTIADPAPYGRAVAVAE
jgi:sulfite reductase beta subunit-like hemoprotein